MANELIKFETRASTIEVDLDIEGRITRTLLLSFPRDTREYFRIVNQHEAEVEDARNG